MQYWDSNSRPLGYESPALTTRPRLSPISNVSFNACLYACPQQVLLSETETGNLESHSSSSSPSAFKSLFAFAFSLQRRSLQVKRDRGWTSVLRGASLSAHSRDKNLLRIQDLRGANFYSFTLVQLFLFNTPLPLLLLFETEEKQQFQSTKMVSWKWPSLLVHT